VALRLCIREAVPYARTLHELVGPLEPLGASSMRLPAEVESYLAAFGDASGAGQVGWPVARATCCVNRGK
jgi:hypothetical protein